MLDWAARIDDLYAYLATEHRMEDRTALEILLSALVACPRTPASWLILETNWYARECSPAWFALGGIWLPHSLAQIRARQPWRPVLQMLTEWLDSPSEDRLFVEPDFERYPYYHALHNALLLIAQCLRVRTLLPRTAVPLATLDQMEEERRQGELAARVEAVIEDRVGARGNSPPVFREPANFLYWVELVQRLSPWYRDWGELTRAFGALAVRHAYLYGRREADERDWAVLARAAADSVPLWIRKAMKVLAEGGGHKPQIIQNAMGLEKWRYSDRGAARELHRLAKAGLVQWHPRKFSWEITEEHAAGIGQLLAGRAFQPLDQVQDKAS